SVPTETAAGGVATPDRIAGAGAARLSGTPAWLPGPSCTAAAVGVTPRAAAANTASTAAVPEKTGSGTGGGAVPESAARDPNPVTLPGPASASGADRAPVTLPGPASASGTSRTPGPRAASITPVSPCSKPST